MVNKATGRVRVEVVYARPGEIWQRTVEVPPGATALQAVQLSRVLEAHPELSGNLPPLGIFGRLCSPAQRLQAGDRVELYRPLVFDPMESRRRRLLHKERHSGLPAGRGNQGGRRARKKQGSAQDGA